MANPQMIEKTMLTLLTAFPSRSYSDDQMETLREIWISVLADIPDAALGLAATEYLKSDAQFAPAPGQLRARAVELMGVDAREMAERAWQKVKDFIRYRDPIEDELVYIAMERAGGMEAFCVSEIEHEHWWHERFIEQYAQSFGRQTAGMALPPGDDQATQLIANVAARMHGRNGTDTKRIRAENDG